MSSKGARAQWSMTSQLRGMGTLMRVVGPSGGHHIERCLARIAEEKGEPDEDVVRCPVCGKSFGEVVSESQLTRHVEACLLCQRDGAHKELTESVREMDGRRGEDAYASPTSFHTVIVGRRYALAASETLRRGLDVRISVEPNNPHDPNALLCTTPSGASIGYLPAVVAAKLAPLLRARAIDVEGVILRDAIKKQNVFISVVIGFHAKGVDDVVEVVDLDAQETLIETLRIISKEHMENLSESSRRFLVLLRNVFETVEAIERRALGDEERALFRSFESLTPTAQLLFSRLCLKNKVYFASNKLHASDVHDVEKLVRELIVAGLCWAVDVGDLKRRPLTEATAVVNDAFCNKSELLDLLVEMGKPSKHTAKRDELVTAVAKGISSEMRLKWSFIVGGRTAAIGKEGAKSSNARRAPSQLLSDACGTIFKIDTRHLLSFHRIIRLFFLNEGQSLGTFHAVTAGTIRYPTFPITIKREVFQDRSQFLEYEDALIDARNLVDAIERAGKSAANCDAVDAALAPVWLFLDSQQNKIPPDETIPPFLTQYSARWLYSVMATVGIGILERQKAYAPAIERIQQLLGGMYCKERRGYWWIRLSVNLEHVGRPTDSLELAETALADPTIVSHERLTLRKRVLKLSKPPRRWVKPVWRDEMPPEPRSITIEGQIAESGEGRGSGSRVRYESADSVEELALQHYASDQGGNYDGIHSESSVFTTIFSLLMWPALFDVAVPDVFRTTLQTAPLDLGQPGFYERRRQKINEIMDAIQAGHAPRLLEQTWVAHHGTTARGIGRWDSWDLKQLQTIVTCIGGKGIAAICRILCEDYDTMTAGMPDLILWNAERGVAKFSEVKSQRDVLSDKQRIWIHELDSAGVDVEVCFVKEPRNGSGAARKKPRHQCARACAG